VTRGQSRSLGTPLRDLAIAPSRQKLAPRCQPTEIAVPRSASLTNAATSRLPVPIRKPPELTHASGGLATYCCPFRAKSSCHRAVRPVGGAEALSGCSSRDSGTLLGRELPGCGDGWHLGAICWRPKASAAWDFRGAAQPPIFRCIVAPDHLRRATIRSCRMMPAVLRISRISRSALSITRLKLKVEPSFG